MRTKHYCIFRSRLSDKWYAERRVSRRPIILYKTDYLLGGNCHFNYQFTLNCVEKMCCLICYSYEYWVACYDTLHCNYVSNQIPYPALVFSIAAKIQNPPIGMCASVRMTLLFKHNAQSLSACVHVYTLCPRKSGYERICQYLTKYSLYIYMIIIYYTYSQILNKEVATYPSSIGCIFFKIWSKT